MHNDYHTTDYHHCCSRARHHDNTLSAIYHFLRRQCPRVCKISGTVLPNAVIGLLVIYSLKDSIGALGSGQTFYIRRGSSSIRKNFGHWKKKKVQVIRVNKRASRVNLKKGDVVLWSGLGHTNIYAGKNSSGERLWFDAGKAATYGHHSGSRFNNIGKKTQGYLNSKTVSYIIRIKGL